MPDRWAVAAGNWSNTATWDGGTLPGAGDDVFADGRAVTIDQDITVLSIRTTQRTGGTAGGSFSVSGTRTINANVIAGTTNALSVASAAVATVNGNVTGGSASNAHGVQMFVVATLNINGTCTGGTHSNASAASVSTGTISVTGNISAATGSGVRFQGGKLTLNGVPTNSNALVMLGGELFVSLTGNIVGTGASGNITIQSGRASITGATLIGGPSANNFAVLVMGGICKIVGNIEASANSVSVNLTNAVANYFLHVVGNVLANSSNAISAAADGAVVVVGNVTGGTTGDGISSTLSDESLIVVHGTVTGGSSAGGHGISHTGNADIRIFGSEVAGSGGSAAVNNTGTGTKTTTAIGGGGSSLPLIGPGGLVY